MKIKKKWMNYEYRNLVIDFEYWIKNLQKISVQLEKHKKNEWCLVSIIVF